MNKFLFKALLAVSCILLSARGYAQTTYYVRVDSGSDANTGTSWATSFRSLTHAMYIAKTSTDAEVDIWVAAGSYGPMDNLNPIIAYRQDTAFDFYRGNGVGTSLKLYGGFNGTEASINDRDFTHITYLTATGYGGFDAPTFHVGIIAGLAPTADSLVIDGFCITGTRTLDTVSKMYNGVFVHTNHGAGFNFTNDSTDKVAIRNCTFVNNTMNCTHSYSYGGAMSIDNAKVHLQKCAFSNNHCQGAITTLGSLYSGNSYGGAIYGYKSTLTADSCTFSNNEGYGGRDEATYATYYSYGGAIHIDSVTGAFTNCTFSGNYEHNPLSGLGLGGALSIAECAPTFESCTFTNNKAYGELDITEASGGAIYTQSGAAPIFTNCQFTGNRTKGGPRTYDDFGSPSPSYGGVIFNDGSYPVFNSCTFAGNSASPGRTTTGVSSAYGGVLYNADFGIATFSTCTFSTDSANGNQGQGGALWNNSGTINADSCTFSNNTTTGLGGAIYDAYGNLNLVHCILDSNNAYQKGGAVYSNNSDNYIYANANVFVYNTTQGTGGAMSLKQNSSSFGDTLVNNVFAFNKANLGGALDLNNYSHFVGNNTFYGDTATGLSPLGGAIYQEGAYSSDSIVNNIFYASYSDGVSDPDVYISVSGGYYAAYNYFSTTEPAFADTSHLAGMDGIWMTADDGLQLTQCSPGIDAGNNIFASAAGTTDITGALRVEDGIINRGAYETPAPGHVTGPDTVCVGSTITLTDTTAGGTWHSSDNTIATVSSTGIVTGVAQGITLIHYTYLCGTGESNLYITVQQPATTIGGIDSLCVGSSTTLTDSTPGGAWSSAGSTASIDSSGLVTGITQGNTNIIYTIVNTCGTSADTINMMVQQPASAIAGHDSVCTGGIALLNDTATGGTWSTTGSVTSVDGVGNVFSVAQGFDTITYSLMNACGLSSAQVLITVNNPISMISGPAALCVGTTVTLTDSASGGEWVSYSDEITIDTAGVMTALSQGYAGVIYSTYNACGVVATFYFVHVDAPAALITGANYVCAGTIDTLFDSTISGTWVSSTTDVATIDTTGIITALTKGISTITYSVTNSCGTTNSEIELHVETPVTPIIAIADSLCPDHTILLTDTSAGGTWNSVYNTIATVSGGIVHAIAPGVDTITYTLTNSCGETKSAEAIYVRSATECDSTSEVPGISQPTEIQIYPNPTMGVLKIDAVIQVNAVLTSIDGRQLKYIKAAKEIDMHDLDDGSYILTLYDMSDNLVKTEKIILKH